MNELEDTGSYHTTPKFDEILSLSQFSEHEEDEQETSIKSKSSDSVQFLQQNTDLIYNEPSMLLQRSCFKSQSVSHILARVFRDMFSYDVMKCDMIDNLYKSCAPGNMTTDDYQRQYVNALRNIQETHEKRMAEADLLERHILEAQTLAYAEERHHEYDIINDEQFDPNIYHSPVPSLFKKHCNKDLLQKHDLICAQDFMTTELPSIKFPDISSSGNLVSIEEVDKMNKNQLLIRSNTSTLRQKLKSEKIRNRRIYLTSTIDPFNKTSILKNMKSLISTDSFENFTATPSEIIFTNYEIGKIYQMTLELKNVSTSLKFVRVIPPNTNNFSINFGNFPSDRGTIAPGLSCIYGIQFCADLLMDYEDFIIVEPEGSKIIKIPIKACRLPPNLNLSDNIHIGDCLINTKKKKVPTATLR